VSSTANAHFAHHHHHHNNNKNNEAGNMGDMGGEEEEEEEDNNDEESKYFPLATLIDSLEFVSLSRGFEPEWACTLLRKLGLSFTRLANAYNKVYMRRDIKWAENASRFLNALYCLVEMFTRAPNATHEADKYIYNLAYICLISS
jgi:hypothetical protein